MSTWIVTNQYCSSALCFALSQNLLWEPQTAPHNFTACAACFRRLHDYQLMLFAIVKLYDINTDSNGDGFEGDSTVQQKGPSFEILLTHIF